MGCIAAAAAAAFVVVGREGLLLFVSDYMDVRDSVYSQSEMKTMMR
jgi:hypothetical protein